MPSAAAPPSPHDLDALDQRIARLTGVKASGPAPPAPPLRRILVGCDGSGAGWDGLRWAAALARWSGGSLRVVCVTRAEAKPVPGQPAPDFACLGVPDPAAVLREASEIARAAGVACTTQARYGPPVTDLVQAIVEAKPDLAVTGSHNQGLTGLSALGSVALAVMTRAPCPVLVARGRPPPTHVIASVDGSPDARMGAALGLALARAFGCGFDAVHVTDEPPRAADLPRLGTRGPAGPALAGGDGRDAGFRTYNGTPHQGLLKASHEHANGLVVIGARGVGVRDAAAYLPGTPGSTSSRVAYGAECSVLLVRRP